jgi:hypothetical protein
MKTLQEALKDVKRIDNQAELDSDTSDAGDDNTEAQMPDVEADPKDDDLVLDLDDDNTNDQQTGDQEDSTDKAPWASVGGGAVDAAGAAQGDEQQDTGEPVTGDDAEGLDAVTDKASEDPDRQGLVRTVKGAHLVYKREGEDGTYEELWIYNVTTLQDEMIVRRAILAGTDIPINKPSSPDGAQQYKMWSIGNAEMLLITGLPN